MLLFCDGKHVKIGHASKPVGTFFAEDRAPHVFL